MFDGLKRKFAFGKLADALEGLRRLLLGQPSTGDGKVLGWTMSQWKSWLEGLGVTAAGGALGVVLQKLAEWQACLQAGTTCSFDFKGVGVATAAGAISAVLFWLKRNPSDPRRTPWDGVDRRQDPPQQ